MISELTQSEVVKGPQEVQDILRDLMDDDCEIISETEESLRLALEYVKEKIVSKNFQDDARHIAVATIHNVDMLVS